MSFSNQWRSITNAAVFSYQSSVVRKEVAETSVDYDRKTKARLYARAGITELWVVDLRANQIEVFRESSPQEYRAHQIFARGEEIRPLAFPDATFPVNEILRTA